MKKALAMLLIRAMLLAGAGCSRKSTPPQQPIHFYYPVWNVVYDGQTELIQLEVRDSAEYLDDVESLLNIYLQGPVDEALRSPFPKKVTVSRYSATTNTAIVELSSNFASLSGIDLTLACACIASTLFDLTQLERVQISATDAQLDGMDSITLERDDLHMIDSPVSPVDSREATTE